MNLDARESERESFYRAVKIFLFVGVIIPIICLVVFMEFRFNSLEREIHTFEPSVRDESRSSIESLPWHPVQGQTLYVPAYSHIYHQSGAPQLLTVTLSVRNTDRDSEIVVTSVQYYNSAGKMIRTLLEKPLQLNALASTEFVVEKNDEAGGSGANFIVEWKAGQAVNVPVVEAVMIDTSNSQGISFVRTATVLDETSLDRSEQ